MRVSDSGGVPTPLTVVDSSQGEVWHGWPEFLPDGQHFLFLARNIQRANTGILTGSLDSEDIKTLLNAESRAAHAGSAETGFLLFAREGALMAQSFDADRLELIGTPAPVAPVSVDDAWGLASFSTSDTGVLVYRTGIDTLGTQLTWFDRRGTRIETLGDPGVYDDPELSPDGRRIAIERLTAEGGWDVWMWELSRASFSRFTFDPGADAFPVWSPDGDRVAFNSDRDGGFSSLYERSFVASGADQPLLKRDRPLWPIDWSSDGRYLLYYEQDTKDGDLDLWVLPRFGDQKPIPYLQTEYRELHGQFSPDGRWVAYVSNESGMDEVYVQSFPELGNKLLVSSGGGGQPRWRGDGNELFYIAAGRKVMAVPVRRGASLEPGPPVELFQAPTRDPGSSFPESRQQYDVTPDGQRFLFKAQLADDSVTAINVVVNRTAGLETQ